MISIPATNQRHVHLAKVPRRHSRFAPWERTFFEASAREVASSLLGHWLVRNTPEGPSGGIIVETEAYLADDAASHGYRGETARNRAMYGPPGRAYIYFIYGNHWCFNAVCRPAGVAEAVLVRALEPALGQEWMQVRRSVSKPRDLASGPAKLCQALDIDGRLDGIDLCNSGSPVFLARHKSHQEVLLEMGPVVATTRIGLSKAAELPLRFYLAGSQHVSKPGSGSTVKRISSFDL